MFPEGAIFTQETNEVIENFVEEKDSNLFRRAEIIPKWITQAQ